MNEHLVSVVFNSQASAEEAAADLRRQGVQDGAISVIAQRAGETTETDGAGDSVAENVGDAAKGALGGAAVGTLLGIAALAIPGVGPLIGAGAIAASAIPSAAAAGAALGAVGGGVGGLLKDHGVDEQDANYFESHIQNGGIFVSVDTREAGISPQAVLDVLERNGGHRSERASTGQLGETTSSMV